MDVKRLEPVLDPRHAGDELELQTGQVINASGHLQETQRNWNIWSTIGVGTVVGSMWPILGSSITVAIYNGGAPGVIYEFLAAYVVYCMVAASLMELASAIPSSAGVYHWATVVAGPRYGRVVGFYAGWFNFFAYQLAAPFVGILLANLVLAMWSLYHLDYVPQNWHVVVVALIFLWGCCLTVMLANGALPAINVIGIALLIGGCTVTVVCLAVLPSRGAGHSSSRFVWAEWSNARGWSSDGFVFCMGMLNAAFAVGTPDVVAHLAEEMPNPRLRLPQAALAQYVVGFVTTFAYLIALLYAISDVDEVLNSVLPVPVVAIYLQGTGSREGAVGLTLLLLLPLVCCFCGVFVVAGRTLWTLARDGAAPFRDYHSQIHGSMRNPRNATLTVGIVSSLICLIYIGSPIAFNALIGSSTVITSLSFLLPITAHLVTRRRYIQPGPFYMRGALGYGVGIIASAYIAAFAIIYCFPLSVPATAANMNYTSVLIGACVMYTTLWWAWKQVFGGYLGPQALLDDESRKMMLSVGLGDRPGLMR